MQPHQVWHTPCNLPLEELRLTAKWHVPTMTPPGNWAARNLVCRFAAGLSPFVSHNRSAGFQFVNEGDQWVPMWGYVATKPGEGPVLRAGVRQLPVGCRSRA